MMEQMVMVYFLWKMELLAASPEIFGSCSCGSLTIFYLDNGTIVVGIFHSDQHGNQQFDPEYW